MKQTGAICLIPHILRQPADSFVRNAPGPMSASPTPTPAESNRILWGGVILAAVLMLATLPGRTQGLALITEPMLTDLALDRVTYANINFWATLLGAAVCLPIGWILDRSGLRWTTLALVLGLAYVVWRLSTHPTGGVMVLFLWIFLTRALGQSALSVASITTAGKAAGNRPGQAMGVYSVLMIVFFSVAFVMLGATIRDEGWRKAWGYVAMSLAFGVAPLALLLPRGGGAKAKRAETGGGAGMATGPLPLTGATLGEALRTRVFWIFAGATALYNLVASGFGLFNEAVLAEMGFGQETFHIFLPVMAVFTLMGQGLCGWLTMRRSMPVLLGAAMLLYAVALGMMPMVRAEALLWVVAGMVGVTTGFITVIFFAVWSQAYGRAHLGRIQGAAQMMTVLSSAIGPEIFARSHAWNGSYMPAMVGLAILVLLAGVLAWRTKLPRVG